MSKYTFVVEFEDGKEPSVQAKTDILGGKLVGVMFDDALEILEKIEDECTGCSVFDEWIDVDDNIPDCNNFLPKESMACSDNVLCCSEFNEIVIGHAKKHSYMKWPELFSETETKGELTKWMPLPEPPKDGE